MPPRVKVRVFEPEDLRRILKIEAESFGRDAWPRTEFERYSSERPELFLVAVIGRTVLGYSIACFTRGGAELASIAVLPRYRGRRVATALLREIVRKVWRTGVNTLSLMVRPDNHAAVTFYRKAGFVRTSTVSRYYEDGSRGWRMKLGRSNPAARANAGPSKSQRRG